MWTFVTGTSQRSRGYSQAVVTKGGRIVWMAGHTAMEDDGGKSLADDFDGQVWHTFRNLERTLVEVGGDLTNITTLTTYLTNAAHWPRLVEIRKQVFKKGYPASAALTVSGLARPELLVEIQAVAVLPDLERKESESQ